MDVPSLHEAIRLSQDYLLSLQHAEGYWVGLLGADTSLPSDYVLIMHFLDEVHPARQRKAIRFILDHQNSEGGWSIYPGGPSDLSTSVKAYFALKLGGHSAEEPVLKAARKVILEQGGLDRVNSFTKIYLAMFGQFGWHEVPAVPPELVLLPETFYFNIYEISSWSRAILVPLTIIYAKRPYHPLPPSARLDELFVLPRRPGLARNGHDGRWDWEHFFSSINEISKLHESLPVKPCRALAIQRAEEWMLERCVAGGLGAVFPSMLNTIVALKVLGYPEDHPKLQLAVREFEALMVEDEETLRFQPCFSPVWDTAISAIALYESGVKFDHPAMERTARWMLSKESRTRGDWHVKNPNGPVSGWYFEFHNEFFPDVDDTAMVLLALHRLRANRLPGGRDAMARGLAWLHSMQNDDGGWGAFDRNNNKMVLTRVPFADHNALLDPSTSDLTGRLLELLGLWKVARTHPAVARAMAFLKKEQEAEGCWYGRWGVNYIYGTWQALRGLEAIGEDMSLPYVRRAVQWLLDCQNLDGGWGESCRSYDDPSLKGQGETTPSQTAWAMMGLISAGYEQHPAVERGVELLLRTQRADGGWDEAFYTGTGFPKVFYLEYTMYRHYFPLLALSLYRDRTEHR
ncbi:MAG: squalene--hopene cyclase [Planctomycetes bacterium]|nr:squalene--hopene cyclase [Planctomycetota bacterium]